MVDDYHRLQVKLAPIDMDRIHILMRRRDLGHVTKADVIRRALRFYARAMEEAELRNQ